MKGLANMPTPEEEKIIVQFRAEMDNAYTEPARPPHRYNAGWYRQMLDPNNGYGPEGTAVILIDGDEITSGLIELYGIKKLHCSSEAIILRPEYRIPDLPSTPERREKARRKLWDNFGYKAPWDDGK
jgi:hypothetical protein